MTIERLGALLAALDQGGGPPRPRDVAELIWLARNLPAPPPGEGPAPGGASGAAETADPSPPDPSPPGRSGPVSSRSASEASASADPGTRLYLPRPEASPATPAVAPAPTAAAPVRLAAPATLPHARELARVLRPLKRRVVSAVRTVLDEDATADLAAERRHWLPVLAPAADRWFDVTLILDAYGDGAAFWAPLGRELTELLRRTGAFRDVRTYCLRPRADGRPGLAPAASAAGTDAASALRAPATTLDPTGRTITLVLTDGVAPQWRSAALRTVLRQWAAAGPTAVVQPLPEHLWDRTALPPVPVRFRSTDRGAHGLAYAPYALGVPSPGPGDIAVPVLGATPEWLGPWAAAVAGAGAFDGAAVLLTAAPDPPLPRGPQPAPPVAFEDFRATAQPRVFRLAAYLAAAPLNLPVMRMVQSTMVPDSPLSDLAEIVFSGLLRRLPGPDGGEGLDAAYEFAPGVRERLLGTIRRDEADEVIAAVSAYADGRTRGAGPRFTAAAPAPGGPLALPAGARHWAEVRGLVRRRQGLREEAGAAEGRRFLITLGAERPEVPPGERDRTVSVRSVGDLADVLVDSGYVHVLPQLTFRTDGDEVLREIDAWAAKVRLRSSDAVMVYGSHTDWAADRYVLLGHGAGTAVALDALHAALTARGLGHAMFVLDVDVAGDGMPEGMPLEEFAGAAGGTTVTVLAAATRPGPGGGTALAEAMARVLGETTADEARPFLDTADTLESIRRLYERLVREAGVAPGWSWSRWSVTDGTEAPLFPNPLHTPALAALASWARGDRHDGRLRAVIGAPGTGGRTLLRRLARLVPSSSSWLQGGDRRLPFALDLPQMQSGATPEPVTLLVDDLDTSRTTESTALEGLRQSAALPRVKVVVATRPERLRLLGPDVEVIDLEEQAYRAAPEDFVHALLAGVRDARALAATVVEWAGGSIALARSLAGAVTDARLTSDSPAASWLSEAEAAADTRLGRFGDDRAEVERWLLPLAYTGHTGAPLPSDVWTALADALPGVGRERRDTGWVVETAADLFMPGTYRLCRAVALYLRAGDDPGSVQALITEALLDLVPRRAEDGRRNWPSAPPYVLAYLSTHAAAAGALDPLLDDREFVLHAEPNRLLRALGSVTTHHGRRVAEVYEASAPAHVGLGPRERGGVLAVEAATRRGFRRLADSFARHLPWYPVSAGVAGLSVVGVFSTTITPVPTLFLSCDDGSVVVRQLPGGTRDHVLAGHEGPVRALDCITIEGRPHAVTGGEDGTVRVWDLTTGLSALPRRPSRSGRRSPVRAVACAMLQGGPYAVLATDHGLEGIHLAGNDRDWFRPQSRQPVTSLVYTAVGERSVAVMGTAESLDAWPLFGDATRITSWPVAAMTGATLDGHPHVLYSGGDEVVYAWNAATDVQTELFRTDGAVTALATTVLDGRPHAVTAEAPGTLVVRDLTVTDRVETIVLPRPARSLTAAGQYVAVAMDHGAVFIDLRPGR
ncbi:SAV_2336 N-terminal domain-related protein [Streptomyces sp. NPDC093546]|uniref:SAV_2336 N-terminal domain-related protein n=1 Tax=Streptomyces sp. NPDC093546 TaxID=3366040 RepID=UPI003815F985